MGKDPAFPLYASDWLGSAARSRMTLEQQGAYWNLLCHQWADKTCSLLDNDEELAALSGMNEGWLENGCQLVRRWFPPHPNQEGRVANPRMLEVRQERDVWIEKSREGGRKSAEVRRAKSRSKGTSGKLKGGSTTVPTKRQPNANTSSPSSSPSSSPKKTPKSPFSLDDIDYPESLDTPEVRKAITEWLEYKGGTYKKPAMQIGKMLRYDWVDSPATLIEAIDRGIGNGWKGIFPPDDSKGNGKKYPRDPKGFFDV